VAWETNTGFNLGVCFWWAFTLDVGLLTNTGVFGEYMYLAISTLVHCSCTDIV